MVGVRQNSGSEAGQSLIETALLLPFLLLITFNAINFGYFFFAALNVSAAPRTSVEYSIQGGATQGSPNLPAAAPGCPSGAVSPLTAADTAYADMFRVLPGSTNATVNVCSMVLGTTGTGASQVANCCTCTSSGSACTASAGSTTLPGADVEAPLFVLHRVDVTYTVQPLIPVSVFGIRLLPNLNFHKQVSMRGMN